MLKIDAGKTREEFEPSRQDMILAFNIYKAAKLLTAIQGTPLDILHFQLFLVQAKQVF